MPAARPTAEAAAIRELRRIPGVGPSIARDLLDLGIHRITDLRGQEPQAMYDRLCAQHGAHIDRCMLYVFRCAVYFAETPDPEPELTLWWSWKDGGRAFAEGRR